MFSSALLTNHSASMSLALASAERRSSAGRSIRPADPIRLGGSMPSVPQSAVRQHVAGQDNGSHSASLVPHILRGSTLPSIPYVSDSLVRSIIHPIVAIRRVVDSHSARMLHGGEQVGKRFPQPKTAMPDPSGPPHHDIALRDTFDRAPAAREGTLQGLATTRGHGSNRTLEPAVKDARMPSGPQPTPATQPPTHTAEGGSSLSTNPHVTQCATHGEIDGASNFYSSPDIPTKSSTMSRGLATRRNPGAGTRYTDERHFTDGRTDGSGPRDSSDLLRSDPPEVDKSFIMSRGLATRYNPRAGTCCTDERQSTDVSTGSNGPRDSSDLLCLGQPEIDHYGMPNTGNRRSIGVQRPEVRPSLDTPAVTITPTPSCHTIAPSDRTHGDPDPENSSGCDTDHSHGGLSPARTRRRRTARCPRVRRRQSCRSSTGRTPTV